MTLAVRRVLSKHNNAETEDFFFPESAYQNVFCLVQQLEKQEDL